jgi:subtilisin-like proprotein convertase family protein/predicted MFS family arabinose efflux permease
MFTHFAPNPLRLLLTALATSSVGDWAYNVARLAFVAARGAAAWLGVVTAARVLPVVLIGPFAGVLVDRCNRRVLMLSADFARAGVMMALAASAAAGLPVWTIAVLAALATALGSAHPACVAATLPRLVSESRLARANAARASIGQAAIVVGPALGAVVLLLSSPETAFLVNALTFIVSAVATAAIAGAHVFDAPREASAPTAGFVAELRDGIRAVRSTPDVVRLLAADTACSAIYGLSTVVLVEVAMRVGHAQDGYGLLLAALGIGGIGGAAAAGRLARPWRRVLIPSLLGVAAALPLLGASTSPNSALGFPMIVGAGLAVAEVLGDTEMQRQIPEKLLGRAFGALVPASLLGIVVGSLMAGPLLAAFGVFGTLAITSVLLLTLVATTFGSFGTVRAAVGGAVTLIAVTLTIAAPAAQAEAPTGLPGCGKSRASFANSTPVPVVDGGTISSTITVAGVGSVLSDVDVQTFLQHQYSADVYMTLTSPAGTVVTLTSHNGGSNENVFDGTIWDDSADPTGRIPYFADDHLATDARYPDHTTEPLLAPEEALAAFNGENPNGVWTLTISDIAYRYSGTLNDWALNLATLNSAPPVSSASFANNAPVAVPDAGVTSSQITVAGADDYLSDVNATTFLRHTYSEDIDMTVTSPAGTVVTLTTDNGGSLDNLFDGTKWDDSADPRSPVPYTGNPNLVTDHRYTDNTPATPLAPEEALGAFIGENPNGVWTLTVADDESYDTGTLDKWSLDLDTAQPCSVPPSISIDDASTAEGDSSSSTADLAVNLSKAWTTPVTVGYTTSDGTASQPGDYAPSSGTLTFAPGETSKAISVDVNGDTADESDETVAVDLSAPSGATIADGHAQLTIADDDDAPATVDGPPVQAPAVDAPGDTAAPETKIDSGPPRKSKARTATFAFSANEAGATFQCSLDGAALTACTSPMTVKVGKGPHTIAVEARDAAGNADASPATFSWTVKKPKRHRHHHH